MKKQKTLEYFFENVKDGDKVGFYRSGIFSYLIEFFQKTEKNEDIHDVSHVANIFNVIRLNKDILSFMISHQTAQNGGSYDTWVIERQKDLNIGVYKYFIKTKTKYTNMYYLQIENEFTEEQKQKGIEYSKSKIGERYGYLSIIAYIPFVSDFIAKYFNFKIFRSMRPVCTTHIVRCDEFAGRNVRDFELKYPFPTPKKLLTYNKEDLKGDLFKITNFKNSKI